MSNLTFKIKEEKLCRSLIWFLKRWMVYFILSKTDSNTNLIFFPYLQLILVRFSSKLIGLMATSYRCPTCRSSNCRLHFTSVIMLCALWRYFIEEGAIQKYYNFITIAVKLGTMHTRNKNHALDSQTSWLHCACKKRDKKKEKEGAQAA